MYFTSCYTFYSEYTRGNLCFQNLIVSARGDKFLVMLWATPFVPATNPIQMVRYSRQDQRYLQQDCQARKIEAILKDERGEISTNCHVTWVTPIQWKHEIILFHLNLERGGNVATWGVHVGPPVEHVVSAGEEKGDPAELGLHKRKLLPSHWRGHRRQRSDAEHDGQRESQHTWVKISCYVELF